MFDFSWGEILVIGAVAIVFIGPKELPGALRTLGQWTGRARSLAREFQRNVDDMIRESEIQTIKEQAEKAMSGNLTQSIQKAIDPKDEIAKAFEPPAELAQSATTEPATTEPTPPAPPIAETAQEQAQIDAAAQPQSPPAAAPAATPEPAPVNIDATKAPPAP